MKRRQLNFVPLVALLLLTSCAGQQTLVSTAEKTTQTAFYSMDLLVHLEHDNRALADRITPDGTIHRVAEEVRKHGLDAVTNSNNLIRVYKLNKNDVNKSAMQTALDVVNELMKDVNFYLPKLQAAGATKKG